MGAQKVLTIEGDWRIRKLIRANLEPLGLAVEEAVSGEHGLELIRKSVPDLILVDLDLPDVDAMHLETVLPDEPCKSIPVIAMSSEPPSRKFYSCERTANQFLQKPFAAPALLQQVLLALGQLAICD
jgi:CheY-like chemotaxis protein